MSEQFKRIYLNQLQDKIMPFLQALNPKEKKAIVPLLREYGNSPQREKEEYIFCAAALICCTKAQFRTIARWRISFEALDDVLKWHCPEWFSEVCEDWFKSGHLVIPYKYLIEWTKAGYIITQPDHIARSLANCVYKYNKELKNYQTNPEIIELYPITLDEHIWALFCHPSAIDYIDNSTISLFDENNNMGIWGHILKQQTAIGRLDRMRILGACLETTSYDFKKEEAGWFSDLFQYLSPTCEELLSLQEKLFNILTCNMSKPINKTLAEINRIAGKEGFRSNDFLNYLTPLLSGEIKSIINLSLTIADKIAANDSNTKPSVCKCITTVFINKDETIQTKAAKLIIKHGNPSELNETLSEYSSMIFMSVRELLKDFFSGEEDREIPDEVGIPSTSFNLSDETNRIKPIETVDDLLFFLSSAFESHELAPLYLLPDALIRLDKDIREENMEQMQLAFRKAYSVANTLTIYSTHERNYTTNESEETTRFCHVCLSEQLLALFFINYGQLLCSRFPKASVALKELHKEMEQADKHSHKKMSDIFNRRRQITDLKDWFGKEYILLRPYHAILQQALFIIKKQKKLPLLSTPTHTPAWITAEVLDERLSIYEQQHITPDNSDLEVALFRCAPHKASDRYPLLINHINSINWKIADEKKKNILFEFKSVLNISLPDTPYPKSPLLAGISSWLRRSIGPRDVKKFILSYPTMPEIPYIMIIKDRLEFAQVADAETRDMLIHSIQTLYDLKIQLTEPTLLFLACCMLCSEKEVRGYAAEIWIERAGADKLNSKRLGDIIGTLTQKEWAPLKRFTDICIKSLINISVKHNYALKETAAAALDKIKTPITNIKKLESIYQELIF